MKKQIKSLDKKVNKEIRCSKRNHKVAEVAEDHIFIKCHSCKEEEIVDIDMTLYFNK